MKRFFFTSFCAIGVACLLLLALHKPIITYVIKHYVFPETRDVISVKLQNITFNHGTIIITNPEIIKKKWQLNVEECKIHLFGKKKIHNFSTRDTFTINNSQAISDSTSSFFDRIEVMVEKPKIVLQKGKIAVHGKRDWRKILKFNVTINDGIIRLADEEIIINFSWHKNTLTLHGPLKANVLLTQDQCRGEIKDGNLNHLCKIFRFFDQPIPTKLEKISGSIDSQFVIKNQEDFFASGKLLVSFDPVSLRVGNFSIKRSIKKPLKVQFNDTELVLAKEKRIKNIHGSCSVNQKDIAIIDCQDKDSFHLAGKIDWQNFVTKGILTFTDGGQVKFSSQRKEDKLKVSCNINKLDCRYLNIISMVFPKPFTNLKITSGILKANLILQDSCIAKVHACVKQLSVNANDVTAQIPKVSFSYSKEKNIFKVSLNKGKVILPCHLNELFITSQKQVILDRINGKMYVDEHNNANIDFSCSVEKVKIKTNLKGVLQDLKGNVCVKLPKEKNNLCAFVAVKNKILSLHFLDDNMWIKNQYFDLNIPKKNFAFSYDFNSFKPHLTIFDATIKVNVNPQNFKIDAASNISMVLNNVVFIIDGARADVFFSQGVVTAKKQEEKEIKMSGKITAYFNEGKLNQINCFLDDFSLDVACLKWHFPQINLEYQGNVHGSVFVAFNSPTQKWQTKTELFLNKLYTKLNPNAELKDFNGYVYLDTEKNVFQVENFAGDIWIKKKKYHLSCPLLVKQSLEENNSASLAFDIKISDDISDVVRIAGNSKKENNQFVFDIDPAKTQIFASSIIFDKLIFDEKLKIKNFACRMKTNGNMLCDALKFFGNFFLKQELKIEPGIFQGALDLTISIDDKQILTTTLSGKNCSLWQIPINDINLSIIRKEHVWHSLFSCDDWQFSFLSQQSQNSPNPDLSNQDLLNQDLLKDWHFDDIKCYRKQKLILQGNGCYHTKSNRFEAEIKDINIDLKGIYPKVETNGTIKGSALVSIDKCILSSCFNVNFDHVVINHVIIENKQPIEIYFFTDRGLILEKVNLDCYDDNFDLFPIAFKADEIAYDMKKWCFKRAHVNVPIDVIRESKRFDPFIPMKKFFLRIFKKSGHVKADMDMEYEEGILQGVADKIRINDYTLQNCVFSFCDQQNVLSYDNDIFGKKFKITHEIFPMLFSGKTTILADASKDTLEIGWQYDEDFKIKSIDGNLYGINFNFYEDNNLLAGNAKIDMAKITKELPKQYHSMLDILRLNSECELKGYLKLDIENSPFVQFNGIFSAKDFAFYGYSLKNIFAKIKFDDTHLLAQDVKISDQSGFLYVDKLTIEEVQNDWYVGIGNVKLKDFRPSLLCKINTEKKEEISPLVVRELILSDLKGKLNELTSLEGRGYLSFINSFKREKNVFDAPSNFLGSIFGADLELHIPVEGRVEYQIKDGKIYLTDLLNAYSEGKRSQFFLFCKKGIPYVAFNGDISVDIRMEQYVVFKFTENFIISLRGTIFNPKSQLVKKKFFE